MEWVLRDVYHSFTWANAPRRSLHFSDFQFSMPTINELHHLLTVLGFFQEHCDLCQRHGHHLHPCISPLVRNVGPWRTKAPPLSPFLYYRSSNSVSERTHAQSSRFPGHHYFFCQNCQASSYVSWKLVWWILIECNSILAPKSGCSTLVMAPLVTRRRFVAQVNNSVDQTAVRNWIRDKSDEQCSRITQKQPGLTILFIIYLTFSFIYIYICSKYSLSLWWSLASLNGWCQLFDSRFPEMDLKKTS